MTTTTIPHPPRRVPILGDIIGLSLAAPSQSNLKQFAKLGPLYRRSIVGGVQLTFAGSAQLMREVLDESTWQRHIGRPFERLRPIIGEGLFTAANDSDEWTRGHSVLMPGFRRDALEGYHATMLEVVEETQAQIDATPAVTDIAAVTGDAALEIIGRCAFGYSLRDAEAERAPFAAAVTRAFHFVQASAIPVLGKFSGRRQAKRHADDVALLKSTVLDVIAARSESGARRSDLLDRMLYPEQGPALPAGEIADQVLTFLIAGHETTGNLMSFALYFLAGHPEVAAEVRAEAQAHSGSDGRIDFAAVAKLRYTNAVLSEALRLWPTAGGFFRGARVDTTLGGYEFKQGEWVFVSLLAVHRDREVWGEDAEEFRPERFLDAGTPGWAYRPFGTGPRACIGRALALHEARLVVASICRDFDIAPPPPLVVEENLTLKPSKLALTFTRRA